PSSLPHRRLKQVTGAADVVLRRARSPGLAHWLCSSGSTRVAAGIPRARARGLKVHCSAIELEGQGTAVYQVRGSPVFVRAAPAATLTPLYSLHCTAKY